MIRCIYSPFTDIYFHLAAEEYLLKQGNENIFMLWQDTPSVVIGKHQRLRSEVDKKWAEQEQVHIARRFSGGGAVYHDLGNINLTFIETAPRLPEFVTYLQRTLDFLNSIGLMAKGGERLGIYLNGLKISGSAQCVHKNRVLYHCTLLYDTDNDDDCGKKPKKLYIHNPNLLNAVCLEDVDTTVLRKSFFLSQLCPMSRITYTERADFLVDGKYRIAVCGEGNGFHAFRESGANRACGGG